METEINVNSVDEIKQHLNKLWKDMGRTVEEIKFEYVCIDIRNGWNTYYVLQRLNGDKDYTVAGMSDGKF